MICNYCNEDHDTDIICGKMFSAHAQPFVRLNQPNPTSKPKITDMGPSSRAIEDLERDLARVTAENEALRKKHCCHQWEKVDYGLYRCVNCAAIKDGS